MSGDPRVTRIQGGTALQQIFGYWPSFHDAEVLSLRLDRGDLPGDRPGGGPRLEADVYVFEITDQVEPNGLHRLRHHTLVTIAFYGVDNLSLSGFSQLNELHGIQFRDIRDRGLESPARR